MRLGTLMRLVTKGAIDAPGFLQHNLYRQAVSTGF